MNGEERQNRNTTERENKCEDKKQNVFNMNIYLKIHSLIQK